MVHNTASLELQFLAMSSLHKVPCDGVFPLLCMILTPGPVYISQVIFSSQCYGAVPEPETC